jgi:protein TonB
MSHGAEPDSSARERALRRARRVFPAFLAGSLAAHAGVLALLPGFSRDASPPPIVLKVTLVQPRPLPVAPPEPAAPVEPPPRKAEPPRRPERAPAPRQVEQPAPVLALAAPQAPAESAFTVPAPKPQEAPEPSAAQKPQQVATVAVVPPSFNAAYLRNPAPPYPPVARRSGEQGIVTLRVLVTPEGLPGRVQLEKTSGSIHLDNAAMEAVKGWRFTPARRGSEAVEGWVLVPIVFRLEG